MTLPNIGQLGIFGVVKARPVEYLQTLEPASETGNLSYRTGVESADPFQTCPGVFPHAENPCGTFGDVRGALELEFCFFEIFAVSKSVYNAFSDRSSVFCDQKIGF